MSRKPLFSIGPNYDQARPERVHKVRTQTKQMYLFPMISLVGHDQEATIINEITEEVLPAQHTRFRHVMQILLVQTQDS